MKYDTRQNKLLQDEQWVKEVKKHLSKFKSSTKREINFPPMHPVVRSWFEDLCRQNRLDCDYYYMRYPNTPTNAQYITVSKKGPRKKKTSAKKSKKKKAVRRKSKKKKAVRRKSKKKKASRKKKTTARKSKKKKAVRGAKTTAKKPKKKTKKR